MKKKIFIAGASSDIGIALVEKYIENGWSVTAHYNKNNKKLVDLCNLNGDLELFYFDFTNIIKLEIFLRKNKFFFKKFDAFVSLTGFNDSKKFFSLYKFNLFLLINNDKIKIFILLLFYFLNIKIVIINGYCC